MGLTLISATPSPFARINRIAMLEKGIPFTLRNEVPWDSTTETPTHNPLEKLPILLFDDGREPVYDSAHIQEYILQKYKDQGPSLLTGDLDTDLKARQIQVLAEGIMDAFVMVFFEKDRGDKGSQQWMARQNRKIDGGMKALDALCAARAPKGTDYLLGDTLTIADIAAVCAVGQIDFTGELRPNWRKDYPNLSEWHEKMDERKNFKDTRPFMFEIKDKIV